MHASTFGLVSHTKGQTAAPLGSSAAIQQEVMKCSPAASVAVVVETVILPGWRAILGLGKEMGSDFAWSLLRLHTGAGQGLCNLVAMAFPCFQISCTVRSQPLGVVAAWSAVGYPAGVVQGVGRCDAFAVVASRIGGESAFAVATADHVELRFRLEDRPSLVDADVRSHHRPESPFLLAVRIHIHEVHRRLHPLDQERDIASYPTLIQPSCLGSGQA